MYDLVSAIGIKEGINQRWTAIANISTMIANESLAMYRTIYFTCNNDSEGTVVIHSDALRPKYGDYTKTFAELFSQSTESFISVLNTPTLNHKKARYSDSMRSHYHTEPYDRLYGNNLPIEALNDALMTGSHLLQTTRFTINAA